WLILGEAAGPAPADDSDRLVLPRYDLFQFSEYGKPAPEEMVPLRREWLMGVRATSGLWLADMPADVTDVAREGDTLVCQDVSPPLVDGRTYIFLLDGRPIVRRVQFRPEGLLLKTGDPAIEPILLSEDRLEHLFPVARVLGSITLNHV